MKYECVYIYIFIYFILANAHVCQSECWFIETLGCQRLVYLSANKASRYYSCRSNSIFMGSVNQQPLFQEIMFSVNV